MVGEREAFDFFFFRRVGGVGGTRNFSSSAMGDLAAGCAPISSQ